MTYTFNKAKHRMSSVEKFKSKAATVIMHLFFILLGKIILVCAGKLISWYFIIEEWFHFMSIDSSSGHAEHKI